MENSEEKEPKSSKKLFFVGLLSGAVSCLILTEAWKPLTKGGIKAGTKGWRKVREISQKALEDIQDVVAEANDELAQEQEQESQ